MFILGIILIVISVIFLATVIQNFRKFKHIESDLARREIAQVTYRSAIVLIILLIVGLWLTLR